jgi:hypothetical protein
MDRLRILTWHVHGSYLDSLLETGHTFYLPVTESGSGAIGGWQWPRDRVHEIPEDRVRALAVDLVLYQTEINLLVDGPRILSDAQRAGPRIFVEHDPPWNDPTDEAHPVDDPGTLLVHVTAFNALMWDTGRTPTRVIEHGVRDPGPRWRGGKERGLVVVNELERRGRKLGLDLFETARRQIPLDLVGMQSERLGGLGEFDRSELSDLAADYRFFYHPVRYTSFGMAVCEALMLGMPVVALATTEMPTVLEHRRSGIVHTDPEELIAGAAELLADHSFAARLGAAGRAIARDRFSIERFVRDWNDAFAEVVSPGRTSDRADGARAALTGVAT